MKLNITLIIVATFLLIAASIVNAAQGGKHDHGPGPGHDHGPRHDHSRLGHDQGHDTGPERDRRSGPGHDRVRPDPHPTEANEMASLEPGRCTKIISATITVMQSYQTHRRVATTTRCGWLHLAHCRKYRMTPHVAYRQVTKLVYVNVRKCCVGFMEVNGVCEPQGGRTLPPTTILTAPPALATTPRDDKMPDDEMMMIDNSMQKFVFFIIVLVAILIIGAFIGGVVVHLCGGRKEVIRRISTRRFARKTRRETTKDHDGKESTNTPKDDLPPRYESINKGDTPVTPKGGVAFHHHHHPNTHKEAPPTAPPYDEPFENLSTGVSVPPKAAARPGNGVQAKSCDSQAGYVEINE